MSSAFGKIILFGEHFVVYHADAIVGALDRTLHVTVAPGTDGIVLQSNNTGSAQERQNNLAIVDFILKKMDHAGAALKIIVTSNIPPKANLGSGAAFCVALTRALTQHFQLTLDNQQLVSIATRAEDVLHGHSSGIDTTAATYGGVLGISFDQSGTLQHAPVALPKALHLLIARSHTPAQTSRMVAQVKAFSQTQAVTFTNLKQQYLGVVNNAFAQLQSGDLTALGKSMNANHQLLQALNVSTSALDNLQTAALQSGALGAKLTGGGGGGSIIILCHDVISQNGLTQSLTEHALEIIPVTLSSSAPDAV